MSLDVYLFTLYLILTFTKQDEQEVGDDLNVCVNERRLSIAWMFLNTPSMIHVDIK